MRFVPMPCGVGEASRGGQGACLACSFGRRFAAAILGHSYGLMHVPGGGGGSHGGEIPKTRGRGEGAQYRSFKKIPMHDHHGFPNDELDRDRVGR